MNPNPDDLPLAGVLELVLAYFIIWGILGVLWVVIGFFGEAQAPPDTDDDDTVLNLTPPSEENPMWPNRERRRRYNSGTQAGRQKTTRRIRRPKYGRNSTPH